MAASGPQTTTTHEGCAGGRWALLLHGGAGRIARGALTREQEAAYRASLAAAAEAGARVLRGSGSALDAVEATVRHLEDDPLFNAGRGAAFTLDGRNELDASIMDGATRAAGAVAGVTGIRNPVSLARAVMERSPHVMLAGAGADAFAREAGVDHADAAWFFSETRWQSLERLLARRGLPIPRRPAGVPTPAGTALVYDEGVRGTVGAVALDQHGNLAAATSTGGITGKRPGRVGDSPLIGAGTWAANGSCAVSGTGSGEHFIRAAVARTIAALVEYRGLSLQAATDEVIHRQLASLGGEGGVIAVMPDGQVACAMNTAGMYRALVRPGSGTRVALYADED